MTSCLRATQHGASVSQLVVCWLALLRIRIAERASGHSWRRIATELQRLHLVTLEGPAGTVQHTTGQARLSRRS